MDVQRIGLGFGRRGGLWFIAVGSEGRRLGPAHETPNYFGGGIGVGVRRVGPQQDAAKSSGGERIGKTCVEGVWVVDGK